MSFTEEFARLRLCLFHYVLCRNLAKLPTVFTPLVLLSTMVSMSHIYRSQIARLCWFCLSRTRDVQFGSNLSKFRSKNFKASLTSFTWSLFSDKVRCFSQSERALYGNFIITRRIFAFTRALCLGETLVLLDVVSQWFFGNDGLSLNCFCIGMLKMQGYYLCM